MRTTAFFARELFRHAQREHAHHGPHEFGHAHGWGRRARRGLDFGVGWGPRARRGDVKYLILEALVDGPRHGYDVIGAVEVRRGFRPSPGSVYPTLQMLEDGGFVTGADVGGKRTYTITDTGRELLAKRDLESDDDYDPDARHRVKGAALKLMAALAGARDSDEATLERVRAILDHARKEIYTLLAADEG